MKVEVRLNLRSCLSFAQDREYQTEVCRVLGSNFYLAFLESDSESLFTNHPGFRVFRVHRYKLAESLVQP